MELIEDACDPGIFGQQFFYSYGTDITLTQQRITDINHDDPAAAQKPQWARADNRFFWNKYLTQPLVGELCFMSDATCLVRHKGWLLGYLELEELRVELLSLCLPQRDPG